MSNFNSYNSDLPLECLELLKNKEVQVHNLKSLLNKFMIFNDNFIKLGHVCFKNHDIENIYELSIRIPPNDDISINTVEYILYDITNIIKVEKELNAIKMKSIVLAKIAHEFKNPIITINELCKTNSNIIRNNPELLAYLINYKKIIKNFDGFNMEFIVCVSDYLLILIEDLNTYVKMDQNIKNNNDNIGYLTQVNIYELLDFCFNIFYYRQKFENSKPSLSLIKRYDPNMPKLIYSVEKKLKQVIVNLMSNAYKFTTYGELVLQTIYKKINDKESLEILVKDTGTGLSKDEVSNLFRSFHVIERNQDSNQHGSGLGLVIVEDILKELDSEIKVKSEIGIGSTFSFVIDITQKNCIKNEDLKYNIDDISMNSNVNDKAIIEININESKESIIDFYYPDDYMYSSVSATTEGKSTKLFEITESLKKDLIDFDTKFKLNTEISKRDSDEVRSLDKDSINADSNNKIQFIMLYIFLFFYLFLLVLNLEGRSLFQPNCINIMICDDERIIAKSIENLIHKVANKHNKKFNTVVTENGIDCLYKICNDYKKGIRYDIMMIDENMPFLLGGEVIRIITKLNSNKQLNKIKIYSITGIVDLDTINYIKSCGADGFYNKPIGISMIENLLGNSNLF